jgi:mono/diheme cytochrome c family protein
MPPLGAVLLHLWRHLLLLTLCLTAPLTLALTSPAPAWGAQAVIDLQQGWRPEEIDLYHHTSEGTNLAPLQLALHLPDPQRPGHLFLEDLDKRYGFIPSPVSERNPHGLPVGLTIDPRPERFGDRTYLGLTCATCHTRELRARPVTSPLGLLRTVRLPVHGGPGLVNLPAFDADFYGAFEALLTDDTAMARYARAVLDKPADAEAIAGLRQEILELLGPVRATREVMTALGVPPADFGPGNLNALTQGNYNNVGVAAWLARKGLLQPSGEQPLKIGFEGTVNLPPVWFAHQDEWAQWFAEIHHPGPRNWVQSVSSSPVRPPRQAAALKEGAIIGSVDFDGIDAIQETVVRLRTPRWPESVFGSLDSRLVGQGRTVFGEHCASCHVSTPEPANSAGRRFRERRAFAVGTDPVAVEQFAAGAERRAAGLTRLSEALLRLRHVQLLKRFDNDATLVANTELADSKGLPNRFGLANDYNGAPGAAYWASNLEGIFASSPYLHNGSVRTLPDLLTPPDQRPTRFHTGTNLYDPRQLGLRDAGPFVYDTSEPGKSAQGHDYGTDLPREQKRALLEYLKSL